MQILPPTAPTAKGREKSELGGHAVAGTTQSDADPDKRHGYAAALQIEAGEEERAKEAQSSALIDRSPISSETQAALLALLSEPTLAAGDDSFADLVEDAVSERGPAPGHDAASGHASETDPDADTR